MKLKFLGVPDIPVTTKANLSLLLNETLAGSVVVDVVVTEIFVNPVTSTPFFCIFAVTEVPELILYLTLTILAVCPPANDTKNGTKKSVSINGFVS